MTKLVISMTCFLCAISTALYPAASAFHSEDKAGTAHEESFDKTIYEQRLAELQKRFSDDKGLSSCFNEASIAPAQFVSLIADVGLCTHSPEWQGHIKASLRNARTGQWSDVQKETALATAEEPDLPDIIVLKALAERKLGQFFESIKDLEYLYNLRKERAAGIKRSADPSKDEKRDEIYIALRSSGQLDRLRGIRAASYEGVYEMYSKAIKQSCSKEAGSKLPH